MMYLHIYFYTFHDFIFGKFGEKEKNLYIQTTILLYPLPFLEGR